MPKEPELRDCWAPQLTALLDDAATRPASLDTAKYEERIENREIRRARQSLLLPFLFFFLPALLFNLLPFERYEAQRRKETEHEDGDGSSRLLFWEDGNGRMQPHCLQINTVVEKGDVEMNARDEDPLRSLDSLGHPMAGTRHKVGQLRKAEGKVEELGDEEEEQRL